jgi:hypothetical protein
MNATASASRAPRLDCLLRCLPGTLTGMEVVLTAHGLGPPDYPAARAALAWLVAAEIAEIYPIG